MLDGSPAARAGLRAGDEVGRINGKAIESPKAARAALADVRPGDPVTLLVRRGPGAGAREQKIVIDAGEGL